jgi:hypothetical protein
MLAAPQDRRILVRGQLESKWPVHGAVLVLDDIAYVSAGRHSDADGGLMMYALKPATGEVVWGKAITGMPGFRDDPFGPWVEPAREAMKKHGYDRSPDLASVNDIPVGNGATVYIGGIGVNAATGEATLSPAGTALFGGPGTMLYDNTKAANPARANWSLIAGADGDSIRMPSSRALARGATLAFDSTRAYGVWPGSRKLELFAADYRTPESSQTRQWVRAFDRDSVKVEALVVSGDKVFAACAPAVADSSGSGSWQVLAFARDNGSGIGACTAGAGTGPRFDGMAAAEGQLYVSTLDGAVVCLR